MRVEVDDFPTSAVSLLPDTAADVAKVRAAWRIVERRQRDGTLFNFTGLERSFGSTAPTRRRSTTTSRRRSSATA